MANPLVLERETALTWFLILAKMFQMRMSAQFSGKESTRNGLSASNRTRRIGEFEETSLIARQKTTHTKLFTGRVDVDDDIYNVHVKPVG